MANKTILVDLWPAVYTKFCGIAQDTRLNFKLFSQLNHIDTAGLIYSARYESLKKYQHSDDPKIIESQSREFLVSALGKPFNIRELTPKKDLFKMAKFFFQLLLEKRCDLYPISPQHFSLLWQEVLCHGLDNSDQTTMQANDYYYSNLTSYHAIFNARNHRNLLLNTSGFDFVYFPQVSPLRVSSNTVKLVRFHDNFPISAPDVTKEEYFKYYVLALENCAEDAVFVCDSEVSRQELLILYPHVEQRSIVIPCALTAEYQAIANAKSKVATVINAHRSKRITANHPAKTEHDYPFILSVGTMEPRKNYLTLLHAWEKLQQSADKSLKLIIVGNPGWKASQIEKELLPHIESGNVVHLENLSVEELATLYSAAQAFVFPSYAEGFGYPPLEAMQCHCPVIASDITTHREIYGDAALYCNPYDYQDLAAKLYELLYADPQLTLRTRLIKRAEEKITEYSVAYLSQRWQQILITDWKKIGLKR